MWVYTYVQALIKNANCFVVIETDHNSEVADSVVKAGMEVEGQEEEEEEEAMPEAVYGARSVHSPTACTFISCWYCGVVVCWLYQKLSRSDLTM